MTLGGTIGADHLGTGVTGGDVAYARRPAAMVWWLKPHWIALIAILPLLIISFVVDEQFHHLAGRPEKHQDTGVFLAGFLAVFAFVLGSWTVSILPKRDKRAGRPTLNEDLDRPLALLAVAFLGLTLLAYALLFGTSLPAVVDVLLGRSEPFKLETIPGVTTMTQFGIVYVILVGVRASIYRTISLSWGHACIVLFILLLTATRGFVNAERLAILEIIIPAIVLMAFAAKRTNLLKLAPILGLASVFVLFASTEYFRTWVPFFQDVRHDFWQFIAHRFLGYYVFSIDNGAGFLTETGGAVRLPAYTMLWFYEFPVPVGQETLIRSFGDPFQAFETFLVTRASPEFNTRSGIYEALIDYGFVGGIAFWLIWGCLSAAIYRSFAHGNTAGLLFYPSWYVGLVEMPRIFYWGETRYFPVILALFFVLFILRAVERQQR